LFSLPWGPGTGVFVVALDELPQGGPGDKEFLAIPTVANGLRAEQIVNGVTTENTAQVCNDISSS